MNDAQTIAAVSSAVGAAARMIVRVSGIGAHAVARGVTTIADDVNGGSAIPCVLLGGARAWAYWFAAPRSYTGEDLVEFHVPGSPILARMLLDRMIELGARQAEPGEFTARAYFNGRMDLTQAEGVAATIAAHNDRELRAARQLLGGELARRLAPVMEQLAAALALLEVGIDFSDEDVTFISAEEVRSRCLAADAELGAILGDSARFERLSHEPRVVLVGRPNAGKSTLLNALAGRQRAVVSDVAGTTRDAIWAEVRLARGVVRVVDVAGVEEGSGFGVQGSTSSVQRSSVEEEIARQMLGQAMREVETGDLIVLVEDATDRRGRLALDRAADLVVVSKMDLHAGGAGGVMNHTLPAHRVSAVTGEGLAELRERLDQLAFGDSGGGAGLALNARHVRLIEEAQSALGRATEAVEAGAELAALGLREALDALGGVLGRMSPDDLLGRVFSGFCIGK